MRQNVAGWRSYLTLLVGASAWAAPALGRHAPKPVRTAPITAITVSEDSGSRPGASGGVGQSWTLRPDGTVSHTGTLSNLEHMEGASDTNVSGTFNKKDFVRLSRYLVSSHVFNLKIAQSNDNPWDDSGLKISMVRGGKTKSIRIPDKTPSRAAASISDTTLALVRAITAKTHWKRPAAP